MSRKEQMNFYLALAGKGVSLAGSSLYGFAMSLYILKITGSASSFALSLLLSTLPRVILSPFVGNLVDRTNKKRIVVGSDLFSGLLMVSIFILTTGSELQISVIYVSEFLLSTSLVFLETAFSASTATIVSKVNVLKMNSWNQTIGAIIQVMAPIIGGVLFAFIDPRLFLIINGISFLLSAASECFIDFLMFSELKGQNAGTASFMADFRAGISYMGQKPMLIPVMLYALSVNFFAGAFSVIFPYDVVQTLKVSSQGLGIIEACFPIGAIIMSILVGSRNMQFTKSLFRNAMMGMAVGMLLFAIPALPMIHLGALTIPYYALSMILFSGVIVAVNVPLGSFMSIYVDESYRGRIMGLMGTGAMGIMPISYILTGLLLGFIPSYIITITVGISIFLIALHIHQNKALVIPTVEDVKQKVEIQEV